VSQRKVRKKRQRPQPLSHADPPLPPQSPPPPQAAPEPEPAPLQRIGAERCRYCPGTDLQRCPRRSPQAVALSLFSLYRYRCESCRRKQFRLDRRRLLISAGIAAAPATIFVTAALLAKSSSGDAPRRAASAPSFPAMVTVHVPDWKEKLRARVIEGGHLPSLTVERGTLLSNKEVIQLSKAGLTEDVILKLIGREGCDFRLDVDSLVELRQAGVSNAVLSAMMDAMTVDPHRPRHAVSQ